MASFQEQRGNRQHHLDASSSCWRCGWIQRAVSCHQLDAATAVFDGDAILATALRHHQQAHDAFITDLQADHATAIKLHREACAHDYSREDASAGVAATPVVGASDTTGVDGDGAAAADDVFDDIAAVPSAAEMERLWRCDVRESLPTLTATELKELCRDNSLPVGGNKQKLRARLGDWLALQDELFSDVPAPSTDVANDDADDDGEVVEAFGITAHGQHRYEPRDLADKRPQVERDMVILQAAQQRELDDLKKDFAKRCTLLHLPPISATLTATVRTDAPQPRRQLNGAWLNKKGRLAQYIGLPGPFAQACKVLMAIFPLHIGVDCQSSWQGDMLTSLDCALLAKMWLHTGKTIGMLATDVDVPLPVLKEVIRTWLPLWGAAAKVLLRLWLDYDYVAECMPAGDAADSVQAELQGKPVSGMPDGKDFKTDRWNSNPLLRRLTYVRGGRGGSGRRWRCCCYRRRRRRRRCCCRRRCCRGGGRRRPYHRCWCCGCLRLVVVVLRKVQQQVTRCSFDHHRVGLANRADRARL